MGGATETNRCQWTFIAHLVRKRDQRVEQKNTNYVDCVICMRAAQLSKSVILNTHIHLYASVWNRWMDFSHLMGRVYNMTIWKILTRFPRAPVKNIRSNYQFKLMNCFLVEQHLVSFHEKLFYIFFMEFHIDLPFIWISSAIFFR